MKESYRLLVLAINVLIPFAVLTWGNGVTSRRGGAIRTAVAIASSWAFLATTATVITKIDLALATSPEEINRIITGDGARAVGALYFGWIWAIGFTVLAWTVMLGLRGLQTRTRSRGAS